MSKYLEEAIRIGNEICDSAIENEGGLYWETMSLNPRNQSIDWTISESIYSGSAGIIFFLIELHKRTNDPRYLTTVSQGLKWLEKYVKDNPTTYYAFYTGRLGVAYIMLIYSEYVGDKSYRRKALDIAYESEVFLETEGTICDLINGVSGSLLALLHIHSITKDEKILKSIKVFTEHLIDHVEYGKIGFYWDRSPKQIHGLCGFSHGASGIAFVFLELGFYFNNPTFYWIAEYAFAYENSYFNSTHSNWPDLRKAYYNQQMFEEFCQRIRNGDLEFFNAPEYSTYWCHGSPGIGLARKRMIEIWKRDYLGRDLNMAIESTKRSLGKNESYNLCHGKFGNCMLLLQVLENEGLEIVRSIGDEALKFKKKYGYYVSGLPNAGTVEDKSLFLGNAGMGLFYLLIDAEKKEETIIIAPSLNHQHQGPLDDILIISKKDLTERLWRNFSGTGSRINLEITEVGLDVNLLDVFIEKKESEHVNDDNNLNIEWELTKAKHELDQRNDNHALMYLESIVRIQKNRELLLLNLKKLFKKEAHLPECHEFRVFTIKKKKHYFLLLGSWNGVVPLELSYLGYLVLSAFQKPSPIGTVIQTIQTDIEESVDDLEKIEQFLISQIRMAIEKGVLEI